MRVIRILKNRGDTIIEVLLALTVVAVVMGGAYASSNRSLQAQQFAQEQSEATKLAESQIERIKDGAPPESDFCFDANSNPVPFSVNPNSDLNLDDFSAYPDPGCQQGPDKRYKVHVNNTSQLYTVKIRWYKPSGDGKNEIKMVYRAP